jgi:hypothetical protein
MGTYHESLSILNPDPAMPATVQLQLLTPNGMGGKVINVTVPAHTNYVADINALLPNRNVSIEAISTRPVVVERTLTFGPNGAGMTARAGINKPATSWLFASGTTENGVQTVLAVMNPGTVPAHVTASFFKQNAGALGSTTIMVPARSRGLIKLNNYVQGGGISSVVTSDQPVVVERSEYAGASADMARAGSTVFGRNGAGVRWTFPGGNTDPNHAEVLVLYNPSIATVPITATFYDTMAHTVVKHLTLAPGAYDIYPVNPVGLTPTNGVVLQSGNEQGFIAEQGIVTRDGTVINNTQGLAQ